MLRSMLDGRVFGGTTGEGPPEVLALHGWRRTHVDFADVLAPAGEPPLAALAPDLPGFGASPPPPVPWGSPEYAALVADLLDAEGAGAPPRPFVVVGHSFGGRVAVHLAAARPDLVAALVLTGVPLAPRPGPRRRAAPSFRAARALHKVGLMGEARMERLRRRYGSADYRASEGVMRGVLVRTLAERYDEALAALACPVELVWGDDDAEVPLAVAEAVVAAVPGATLTVCPGAGHLTPLTVPGVLRAAVLRALGRVGDPVAGDD